jgi:hypothetical protein
MIPAQLSVRMDTRANPRRVASTLPTAVARRAERHRCPSPHSVLPPPTNATTLRKDSSAETSTVTPSVADSGVGSDIGPATNIAMFMKTILSDVNTPNPGTSKSRVALQKRRLLNCPTMLEADTLDTIKMVGWMQAAEQCGRAHKGHMTAFETLELTTSVSSDNKILDILAVAVAIDNPTDRDWIRVVGQILATIPGVVAITDVKINNVIARGSTESPEVYYQRFKTSLSLATWVRRHMSKDISSDWVRPHPEAWASKLGDYGVSIATMSLPVTATLTDYYINASKGFRVLGGINSTK